MLVSKTLLSPANPIFVAVDTPDLAAGRALVAQVAPHVGGIKLGLEFFTIHGASGVREIMGGNPGLPLFLDLKFHDIPNTVAGAVRSAMALQPALLTIHTAGGRAMMEAAAAAKGPDTRIVGVTVLTSLDAQDLADTGCPDPVPVQTARLARLAVSAGLDGVVCSAHEVTGLRTALGAGATLVVPGIRPAGSAEGDQKRVMTPQDALNQGASVLVIGRPITAAADPAQAARAIAESLR